MSEWHFLLTPLAILALLSLFRFIGCDLVFQLDEFPVPYHQEVLNDSPVSYWRFQEKSPPTLLPGGVAIDTKGQSPGTYDKASAPITADTQHRSPEANPIILELGVMPGILLTDPTATALKIQGGFVQVTVPSGSRLTPPQFTLEALVLPDPTLVQTLGRFHCLIESSDQPAVQTGQRKKFGYAIYAGPDDPADPLSPYHWQLWVGTGTEFKRVEEQKPYSHPANEKGELNPGPQVLIKPTYLAVTYDGSTFLLYAYQQDSDIDFVKYELVAPTPDPYAANVGGGDLLIGITGIRRPLFPPFPGPSRVLYPFWGAIEEIAVYDKALIEDRVLYHAAAAFHGG